MNKQGILLFGGTFDPIHNGHLIVCRAVAEKLAVEKAILIPAAQPPHKQVTQCSDANGRLAMAELAVEDEELFEVSDCEMNRSGPSYTLDTVKYFRERFGSDIPLYWLIGADSIKELPSWYKIKQLADQCTIITALRGGYDKPDFSTLKEVLNDKQIALLKENCLDTPMIEISSTQIRQRIALGLSINYLIPPKVNNYIRQNSLYVKRR